MSLDEPRLWRRLSFPHRIAFAPLSEIRRVCFRGSNPRSPILSCDLFVSSFTSSNCVLIAAPHGKSGSCTALVPQRVPLQHCAGCPGSLAFSYKLSNQSVNIHKIPCWDFDWGCTESPDQVGENWPLDIIESSYPRERSVSP